MNGRRVVYCALMALTSFWSGILSAQPRLPFAKSYALVIGINQYAAKDWRPLTYARRDGESIAGLLRDQGFDEVITLFDERATKTAIISTMQDNLARRLTDQDRVLIFFAGHGYTDVLGGQDRGYLIPYDAAGRSSSYISLDELRQQASNMNNARHVLFLIDACYGGLLTVRASLVLDPRLPDYVQQATKRYAKQVLSAGGKGQQVVDGGPNGHSLFVGAILEGIRDGLADFNADGYVSFAELVSYVGPRATNQYQTPSSDSLPGHQGGEFMFLAKSPTAARIPSPAPGVPRPVLRGEGDTSSQPPKQTIPEVGGDRPSRAAVDPNGSVGSVPTQSTPKRLTFEDVLKQMGAKRISSGGMGSSSLSGRVMDASGAVIPGAVAALYNPTTKDAYISARSDANGWLRMFCSTGGYYLLVTAPGFKIAKGPFGIASSSGGRFEVTLQVGSSEEVVDVKYR